MIFLPVKTDILTKNFNLAKTAATSVRKAGLTLREEDILIISSKIVALSEGRIVDLKTIKPSKRALAYKRTRYGAKSEDPRIIELILRETPYILPGKMILALKDNIFMPSAGIDLSNAPKDFAILLPKNPWQSAQKLRKNLRKIFRIKKLGVVICDSHCQPLRWGTTGIALSWTGFEGIEDSRGQKDIYGKKLRHTKKAVADNLACAALLLMGEAGEKIPLVIARSAPVRFTNLKPKANEISMKPEECLFGGIVRIPKS